MRIFIIHIFCIVVTSFLAQAQELSIELSVEWTKSKIPLHIPPITPNDSIVFPMLKLTYRNLTQQDIYARKVFYRKNNDYPPVICVFLVNTDMDLADQVQIPFNYYGTSYTVEIGKSWEVFEQGFDRAEEYEPDIINHHLCDIYAVLEAQQSLDKLGINKQLSCFRYPNREVVRYYEAQGLIFDEEEKRGLVTSLENDFPNRPLTEDEINQEYADAFIFLKTGKTYEQKVSLIGFYLLGGNYEFLISDNLSIAYSIGRQGQKISLPKLVNGYRRCEGPALTNTVRIKVEKEKK